MFTDTASPTETGSDIELNEQQKRELERATTLLAASIARVGELHSIDSEFLDYLRTVGNREIKRVISSDPEIAGKTREIVGTIAENLADKAWFVYSSEANKGARNQKEVVERATETYLSGRVVGDREIINKELLDPRESGRDFPILLADIAAEIKSGVFPTTALQRVFFAKHSVPDYQKQEMIEFQFMPGEKTDFLKSYLPEINALRKSQITEDDEESKDDSEGSDQLKPENKIDYFMRQFGYSWSNQEYQRERAK